MAKSNIIKWIVIVVLLVIAVSSIIMNLNLIKEKDNLLDVINVKDRSISNYIDKEGKLNSKIKTLSISFDELKHINNTSDSMLNRVTKLYKESQSINKRLNTIIAFNTKVIASYSDSLENTIIAYSDSLPNSNNIIYPTYYKKFDMFGKWINGSVTLGKDTTNVDIQVISSYDIILYKERDNIFSKYKLYANVKLDNPYDTTQDFIVVQNDIKPNRIVVSAFGGYGLTIYGFSPFIGLGVGLKLFEL